MAGCGQERKYGTRSQLDLLPSLPPMNFGSNSDYLWSTQTLTWNGSTFAEPEADFLWSLMPPRLQAIARAEMGVGNAPASIQLDRRTFVPLMRFRAPPLPRVDAGPHVIVHIKFVPGNYCYDGTHCTYELLEPRSFLAFGKPAVEHDAQFA